MIQSDTNGTRKKYIVTVHRDKNVSKIQKNKVLREREERR